MINKRKTFVFSFCCSVLNVVASADSDRISALEKRVETLEATLTSLEPLFVARYGLIRNCLTPPVLNGEVVGCDVKLKPGTDCRVVCHPGYISTPGKEVTRCKEDGFWTVHLQCEIPLVFVSGGTVDQSNNGDSGIEVLSFYPSKGCDQSIADMPIQVGSPRSLHNLVYIPPKRLLACNGMTSNNEATCDVLTIGNNTWKHHSYPNKPNSVTASLCDFSFEGFDPPSECKKSSDRKKGRYAAEALHVGGETVIVGGMVYDGNGHDPSKTIRQLSTLFNVYWQGWNNLQRERAFFCTVKVKSGGFLAIGGLGRDKKGNIVEKSVEFRNVGFGGGLGGLKSISKFADMIIPRTGHSCTGVPGIEFSALVSGGTQGFGQIAMGAAEIFNWNSNSWTSVAEMKRGRFGHAVVAVGEKIFAIGGDDRNPNNVLDTIEEYDVKKNSWKIIKKKLKKPRSNFGFTLVPHSIFAGCVVSRPLDE